MSTDQAWKEWGEKDPYFGVITDPKFRRSELTDDAIADFFVSGEHHVEYVYQMIRTYIDPHFAFTSALDFGCGVGRIAIPLATRATRVVGIDIAEGMLAEARKNAETKALTNVDWQLGDETLSRLGEEKFALVHSFIVLQHIPVVRGVQMFQQLLSRLAPGGIGAVHFTYAKAYMDDALGMPAAMNADITALRELNNPPSVATTAIRKVIETAASLNEEPPKSDPEMLMNSYPINPILYCLQRAKVQRFHVEFTDHGGELGLFVFWRMPT
jgi:SAM-dependent methyltransferase